MGGKSRPLHQNSVSCVDRVAWRLDLVKTVTVSGNCECVFVDARG
jgi:hypothetical protein